LFIVFPIICYYFAIAAAVSVVKGLLE